MQSARTIGTNNHCITKINHGVMARHGRHPSVCQAGGVVSPSLAALLPSVSHDELRDMVRREPRLSAISAKVLFSTVLRLKQELPHADLGRVVCASPSLLADDPIAFVGALAELRQLLPRSPLVEFLVQEEPSLIAGSLSLERLEELRAAWDLHGASLDSMSDAALNRALMGPPGSRERLGQWIVNVFVNAAL